MGGLVYRAELFTADPLCRRVYNPNHNLTLNLGAALIYSTICIVLSRSYFLIHSIEVVGATTFCIIYQTYSS